jgi:hypothetical protein
MSRIATHTLAEKIAHHRQQMRTHALAFRNFPDGPASIYALKVACWWRDFANHAGARREGGSLRFPATSHQ